MHACFTPPPTCSVEQFSPTHEMNEPCHKSIPLGDSPFCDTQIHHDIGARIQSKTYTRQLSPSSNDTTGSDSLLKDELHALPGPPTGLVHNLSRLVTCAQRQFKPYDLRQIHMPNAIELHFVHRSLGKYSGETDMSLVDVKEVC
jgi:hypothetical protein